MQKCDVALLLPNLRMIFRGNNSTFFCLQSHSCQHGVTAELVWIRKEFLM